MTAADTETTDQTAETHLVRLIQDASAFLARKEGRAGS
jgi:hypothetical protein